MLGLREYCAELSSIYRRLLLLVFPNPFVWMSHRTNYKVYHICANTPHYLASLLALPSLVLETRNALASFSSFGSSENCDPVLKVHEGDAEALLLICLWCAEHTLSCS
jgi:hypothetical protein